MSDAREAILAAVGGSPDWAVDTGPVDALVAAAVSEAQAESVRQMSADMDANWRKAKDAEAKRDEWHEMWKQANVWSWEERDKRVAAEAEVERLRAQIATCSGSCRDDVPLDRSPAATTGGASECSGEGDTCLTHGGCWEFNDEGLAVACDQADMYPAPVSSGEAGPLEELVRRGWPAAPVVTPSAEGGE